MWKGSGFCNFGRGFARGYAVLKGVCQRFCQRLCHFDKGFARGSSVKSLSSWQILPEVLPEVLPFDRGFARGFPEKSFSSCRFCQTFCHGLQSSQRSVRCPCSQTGWSISDETVVWRARRIYSLVSIFSRQTRVRSST